MLLNYHIGRFVLVSLCVGDLVGLGLSSIRVAGLSVDIDSASLDSAVHTRTTGKYAAITPSTSMLTDTTEPLL